MLVGQLILPYSVSMYPDIYLKKCEKGQHLYAITNKDQQLPSKCVTRITKQIHTTDSRSDKETIYNLKVQLLTLLFQKEQKHIF